MKDISNELHERQVFICDVCFSAFELTAEDLNADQLLYPVCDTGEMFTIVHSTPEEKDNLGLYHVSEFTVQLLIDKLLDAQLKKLQSMTPEQMVEEVAKKLLETYNWGAGAERAGYYDPDEAQEAIDRDAREIASLFLLNQS